MAKKEKHEYYIFSAHESYINERLPEYEKDGWEVAGENRHVNTASHKR